MGTPSEAPAFLVYLRHRARPGEDAQVRITLADALRWGLPESRRVGYLVLENLEQRQHEYDGRQ